MGIAPRWSARESAGRVSLTRRLSAASLLALLVLVLGGGLVVVTAQQLSRAQQQLTGETRARQATSDLLRQYVDQETGLRGYVLTGEEELLAPFELAQRQLPGVRRDVREGLRTSSNRVLPSMVVPMLLGPVRSPLPIAAICSWA
jgi:CHASE3 domain sensor protein